MCVVADAQVGLKAFAGEALVCLLNSRRRAIYPGYRKTLTCHEPNVNTWSTTNLQQSDFAAIGDAEEVARDITNDVFGGVFSPFFISKNLFPYGIPRRTVHLFRH